MEDKLKKTGMLCFGIALITELIIVIIDKSAYINPYESQIFRLTFLLFCIKLVTTKYSRKEWLCIFIFGIIAMISYLINERDEAVRAVVFIASCKDCSLRKNMQLVFYVTLIGCALLVLLSITGIYGSFALTADYGRGTVETRYTMGMGHPNAFHCMVLMLITLFLYLYSDAMKWYHYIAVFIMNLVTYLLSDSNTGMVVGTAIIVGVVLMRYLPKTRESKWAYIAGGVIVAACIVFSVIGACVGNGRGDSSTLMFQLDKLLNGRYESCYKIEAARLENWRLFAAPENVEYFDAGFVRLFYWYGIVPAIAYIGMHFYLIFQSWKHKDYGMLVMVTGFSIYNLMEAHFISVYLLRNYLLVLMGYYWYQPFAEKKEFEGYLWQVQELLGKA